MQYIFAYAMLTFSQYLVHIIEFHITQWPNTAIVINKESTPFSPSPSLASLLSLSSLLPNCPPPTLPTPPHYRSTLLLTHSPLYLHSLHTQDPNLHLTYSPHSSCSTLPNLRLTHSPLSSLSLPSPSFLPPSPTTLLPPSLSHHPHSFPLSLTISWLMKVDVGVPEGPPGDLVAKHLDRHHGARSTELLVQRGLGHFGVQVTDVDARDGGPVMARIGVHLVCSAL